MDRHRLRVRDGLVEVRRREFDDGPACIHRRAAAAARAGGAAVAAAPRVVPDRRRARVARHRARLARVGLARPLDDARGRLAEGAPRRLLAPRRAARDPDPEDDPLPEAKAPAHGVERTRPPSTGRVPHRVRCPHPPVLGAPHLRAGAAPKSLRQAVAQGAVRLGSSGRCPARRARCSARRARLPREDRVRGAYFDHERPRRRSSARNPSSRIAGAETGLARAPIRFFARDESASSRHRRGL
jgi:hypothetical protein